MPCAPSKMLLSLTVPNVGHLSISFSLEEGIHFGCRDKTVTVPLAYILPTRIFCYLLILPALFNALWVLDILHNLMHMLVLPACLLLPSLYGSRDDVL